MIDEKGSNGMSGVDLKHNNSIMRFCCDVMEAQQGPAVVSEGCTVNTHVRGSSF
jgi:hypothetical protein